MITLHRKTWFRIASKFLLLEAQLISTTNIASVSRPKCGKSQIIKLDAKLGEGSQGSSSSEFFELDQDIKVFLHTK